jgi:hypothetical protein
VTVYFDTSALPRNSAQSTSRELERKPVATVVNGFSSLSPVPERVPAGHRGAPDAASGRENRAGESGWPRC